MLSFKTSEIIKAVRDRAKEACQTCTSEQELEERIAQILSSAWIACGKDVKRFAEIEDGVLKGLDFEVKEIEKPHIEPEKTYLEKIIQAAQDLGVDADVILRALELERYDDIMQIANNVTDDPDFLDETF